MKRPRLMKNGQPVETAKPQRKPGEPRDEGDPLTGVMLFKDGHRTYPPVDRTPHSPFTPEEEAMKASQDASAMADTASEMPKARKKGKRKPARS